VSATWKQDPLFPLWWVGALVRLRGADDPWCCWGRVEGHVNDHWVKVSWSWLHFRNHAHVLDTVHEDNLEYVKW